MLRKVLRKDPIKKEMEEGYSTNKPSLLRGIKYDYCKERVTTHFESIHIDLWEVVENDNYISYDVELNEILRSIWKNP